MIVVMPARWAPRTFSFTPPIGSTRPRSVISPVIATSRRTGRPDIAETSAVAIATPADGPSLGIAPAGTWTWTSIEPSRSSGIWSVAGVRRGVGQRGAGRLLHHVAELAGEDQRRRCPSRLTSDRLVPLRRRGRRGAGGSAASTNMMSPPAGV